MNTSNDYISFLPFDLRKELERFCKYEYFRLHEIIVQLLMNGLEFLLLDDAIKNILNFSDSNPKTMFLRVQRLGTTYGGKLSYEYMFTYQNSSLILVDMFTLEVLSIMIIKLYKFLRKHGFVEFCYIFLDIVNTFCLYHRVGFIPRGITLEKRYILDSRLNHRNIS
jgi:hypothetical protein